MKKLEIVLDEESDEILASLATAHSGDRNRAVREALRMHNAMQGLLDQIEEQNSGSLRRQKERSEKEFREGKFTTWAEGKRKTRL